MKPLAENPTRLLACLLGLLLFALAFALFAPSLSYELVRVDDLAYVTHHTLVLNGLSPQALRSAFSPDPAVAPMYMPLLWISYMCDVSLFNASPTHPWGFHFTNVLLHAFNSVLFFLLLHALCKKPWRAFFFAALWALHPLRVESVAWVTERKDVLSGFFCLLSVACHVWAHRGKTGGRIGPPLLSLGFFVGALLAKPSVVPLPFVLLLLDFWPLRRVEFTRTSLRRALPKRLLEKTPFFIAALAIAFAAIHGHQTAGALSHDSLWARSLQVPIHYGFYLSKIFLPTKLGPLYPLVAFSWTRFLVAGAILIVPSVWAWKLRLRCPHVGVGWLWFLIFFTPIIGFFGPVGVHGVADRFTYLPAMGLSIALLSLGRSPADPARRKPFAAGRAMAAGGLLALLCMLTLRLLPIWRNSDRLFERIASLAPDHPATRNIRILGQLKLDGDFQSAQTALEQAFAAHPLDVELMASLALCIHERQGAEAALDFLDRHRPAANATGEWDLQMALYSFLGAKYDSALRHVDQARRQLSPNDAAQNNLLLLGMAAAFEQGDAAAALAFARELPPYRSHAEIALLDLFPLHSYLWDLGLRRDALAYFRRLVQAHPGRGDLLNNVAWLLSTSEWSPAPPQEAIELAQRAQALAPAPHPVLLDTWAVALANANDFEKAIQATRQALELTPETPPNTAFRRNLQARIERYRLSQPYREEAATRLW